MKRIKKIVDIIFYPVMFLYIFMYLLNEPLMASTGIDFKASTGDLPAFLIVGAFIYYSNVWYERLKN